MRTSSDSLQTFQSDTDGSGIVSKYFQAMPFVELFCPGFCRYFSPATARQAQKKCSLYFQAMPFMELFCSHFCHYFFPATARYTQKDAVWEQD